VDQKISELQSRLVDSQPYVNRSVLKEIILSLESWLGETLFKRLPPVRGDGPRLLHLGCGNVKFPEWVNADFYNFHDIFGKRDYVPDWMLDLSKAIRSPDGYWDGIFTEHCFEHLTYAQDIHALKEVFRILKPGAWVRIVTPDVSKYISYYRGELSPQNFDAFPGGPAAISNVTQGWGHRSAWDGKLFCNLLRDIGFVDVAEVEFGKGSDPQIIKDLPGRSWESLYVEGRHP
jgi:SAM-dependent methyltransferase